MEEIRARVDEFVDDPGTAEALKPYYRQFCKRPCFNDQYLPTFSRPNVTLVDTEGRGVERITKHAVIAGGETYELDCLIYATGFEVGTDYTQRAGCEIFGRGGQSLREKWAEQVATFHGMLSRGFPNCFFMGGIQSGVTPNFTELYGEQSQHIAYVVKHARNEGWETLEASEQAEANWVATILESAKSNQDFQLSCTPGYYNNEGHDNPLAQQNSPYGEGSIQFFARLAEWRNAGGFEGLEFERNRADATGRGYYKHGSDGTCTICSDV